MAVWRFAGVRCHLASFFAPFPSSSSSSSVGIQEMSPRPFLGTYVSYSRQTALSLCVWCPHPPSSGLPCGCLCCIDAGLYNSRGGFVCNLEWGHSGCTPLFVITPSTPMACLRPHPHAYACRHPHAYDLCMHVALSSLPMTCACTSPSPPCL